MSNPTEGPNRIDYQETADVTEVHAAVEREKPEPSTEVTPIPMWLAGVCVVAIIWASAYFGIFNGGLSGNVYNEYESSPAVLFPIPQEAGAKNAASDAPPLTLAQQGKAVFANCVTCHQANGMGVPGQYPPLAGSDIVQGGEKRVVAILLKGLQGPISVSGKPFVSSQQMPPWEATLSPKKIAAVLSYVRSEWGNKGGEITEEQVVAAKKEFADRTTPWTEADLAAKAPADATLPGGGGAAPAGPNAAPAATGGAAPAAAATAAPAAAGGADQLALGKATYMTICIACHQPTGAGLPGTFPPLVKSPYVNGPPERLAAIILKGNMGPFTVDGKPYGAIPMPPQEAALTDEKIAAVETYVRANFGNSSGPVAKEVATETREKFKARANSWTQPELDAWK